MACVLHLTSKFIKFYFSFKTLKHSNIFFSLFSNLDEHLSCYFVCIKEKILALTKNGTLLDF